MIRAAKDLPTLFLLAAVLGAQAPSRDASVGIWPWLVGNIDADVPTIIARSTAAGLDTIYLHLFRTTAPGLGTLHMVDEAQNWNPARGPVDPDVNLTSFLAQAHAAQLQVVGVVNCFLDVAPLPGSAAHELLLLEVIDYLVNNFGTSGDPVYRLDGIAIDRCRFYAGTTNPAPVVTNFVQRVKERLGKVPLHAFVMANLYTFDGPTYNGVFNSFASCMNTLAGQFGQDWVALAPLLDAILPMAYIAEAGLYGSNTVWMRSYVQATAAYARQAAALGGNPTQRVVPAIRAWNDATGTTTVASLDASMTGALGAGDGFMPFRYYTMQGQTAWWNQVALRTVPGPALPLAQFLAQPVTGQTVLLDAAPSTSLAHSPSSLLFRWDFNDDGVADTAWSASRIVDFLAPTPGAWRVAVEVRDPDGKIAVRKKRVTIGLPSLSFIQGSISASLGGVRPLMLNLGPAAAGDLYLVVGSASGTSPGVALTAAITIPLHHDAFSDFLLQLVNSPYLPGFSGVLSATGTAAAAIVLPPLALPPALVWSSFHFAALGAEAATLQWSFATNAVPLLILP